MTQTMQQRAAAKAAALGWTQVRLGLWKSPDGKLRNIAALNTAYNRYLAGQTGAYTGTQGLLGTAISYRDTPAARGLDATSAHAYTSSGGASDWGGHVYVASSQPGTHQDDSNGLLLILGAVVVGVIVLVVL